MTSSLFTQVWLWSFAAFVLGVLVNYVLFVRPLRKRLRAREEDLVRFEDELVAEPSREERPLDILDGRDDDDGGWERVSSEPAEPVEPAERGAGEAVRARPYTFTEPATRPARPDPAARWNPEEERTSPRAAPAALRATETGAAR